MFVPIILGAITANDIVAAIATFGAGVATGSRITRCVKQLWDCVSEGGDTEPQKAVSVNSVNRAPQTRTINF